MSWNRVGSKRSGRRSGSNFGLGKEDTLETNSQIRLLLETHKTKPCDKSDIFHDARLCKMYHPHLDDQRRNPYRTYYSPDDGTCLNKIEIMYHPIVFRTALCQSGSKCIFGKKCARAHSEKQLRDRIEATDAYYDEHFQPVRQKQSIASSLDLSLLSRGRSNFSDLAKKAWKEKRISPTTILMKIEEHLWFAVNRSNELFYRIQEAAFEEGLGAVNRDTVNNEFKIRGIGHNGIMARINSLLDEPSPYFASRIMNYSERINTRIRASKIDETSKAKNLYIQFMSDGKLRITGVRRKGQGVDSAKVALENEIAKLDFWIKQEKYDDFYSCGCCYELFNMDQGITCENGHFYCSSGEEESEQCFATLAKSQFLQLSTRQDHSLLCPICSAPYGKKAVASNLSSEVFDQYQGAIVDAKVSKKADEMNNRFNERLQSAVAEVLDTYGNAELRLLKEAKTLADEARNTVLNLRCPHCQSVYFDFTGCMAIQCERCKGQSPTGRGAHEHVRQCLFNETDDGNYYANAQQIRDAQKRYRTREIKKFLRKHKKNVQNAIVIELRDDLTDLDIKQEALFELGNLM